MEHLINYTETTQNSRHGLHYFADTVHYRDEDLHTWLPELKGLGASWIVLNSEIKRAIPESFISVLIAENICPIIHFKTDLNEPVVENQIESILTAYAKWGVKHVVFFDRPNSRNAWGDKAWTQHGLVERFLEQYLPIVKITNNCGLTPIFPPLEPGGSFWDTVFLRQTLEKMQALDAEQALENFTLSCYAWTWNQPLNWGAGGPERWPQTRPYRTPTGSQDQRGFCIYEWYQAIVQAVLQKKCPIFLFQAGLPSDPKTIKETIPNNSGYKESILNILRLLNYENAHDPFQPDESLEIIPEDVVASCFWLLSADQKSPYYSQAWYQAPEKRSILAQSVIEWSKGRNNFEENQSKEKESSIPEEKKFSISRYLLLPSMDWLIDSDQRIILQTYIDKYHPTIGFSSQEAVNAAVVVVAGNEADYPEGFIDQLRDAGCLVKNLNACKSENIDLSNMEDYGTEAFFEHTQHSIA